MWPNLFLIAVAFGAVILLVVNFDKSGLKLNPAALSVTATTQWWIAVPVLAFFVGGFIKGVFGIGVGLIAVAATSFVLKPSAAIALIALPMVVTNIRQAFPPGRKALDYLVFWRLIATMTAIIFASAFLVAKTSSVVLGVVAGAMAIAFALFNLGVRFRAVPKQWDSKAQWIAGIVAGVSGGFSGIATIPVVAYLQACRLERDWFVQATGFILLWSAVVILAAYLVAGVLTPQLLMLSVLMLLPCLAGMWLGERVRRTLNTQEFRNLLLVLILFIGEAVIWRNLA